MPCGFNWSNSNTKLMNIPAAFLYLMKDKLGRSSSLIILVHGRADGCMCLFTTRVCWRTSFIHLPTLSSHSWSEEKPCSFKKNGRSLKKKKRKKGWFRIQIQIFERACEGAAGISAHSLAMTAANKLLFQAVCVPSGTVMRWWMLCALQMLWDDRWAVELTQEKWLRLQISGVLI